MTTTHTYYESGDRGFCDFCTDGDPFMTWRLPPGRKLNTGILDKSTGELIEVAQDADGLWTACDTCHKGILVYKKAKVKQSALRKFTNLVASRTKTPERAADLPGAAKLIRQYQKRLFSGLLPHLSKPYPYTKSIRVIKATGSEEMVKFTREMRERMHADWEKRHPESGPRPEAKVGEVPDVPNVSGPDLADGQTRAVSPRRWT